MGLKKNKNSTYIIAEAGVNHNGSVSKAIKLVHAAKAAGANAVKFQLFNSEEQISRNAPTAPYQRRASKYISMSEMAKSYDMPLLNHLIIKKECDKLKIDYMASCFDKNSVDFLFNKLKLNYVKVGSGEITNFNLLKYIAKKIDTIILSTGMSDFQEISKAINEIKRNSNNKSRIIIMHCVSLYPTKESQLNLNTIKILQKKYDLEVGFSDHTLGYEASKIAFALGCRIIEKHLTLNKNSWGPDHKIALNPKQFLSFVEGIKKTEIMMGNDKKNISKEEKLMRNYARRSIVASKFIAKGEKISKLNITFKRPGTGINPLELKNIIDKKTNINIKEDTLINLSMLRK